MAKVNICEVNDVIGGYNYWRQNLRDKLFTMARWCKLPPSLPSSEIMYRIINRGFAVIFKHPEYGFVTSNGGLSGVSIYNHPTYFVYAQSILGSGTLEIGKDCAVITAGKEFWFTRYRPQDVINRYSRLLADIDASLDIAVVNTRMTRVVSAANTKIADDVRGVYESIRMGKFAVATENQVVKQIAEHQMVEDKFDVASLLTLRDAVIKAYWAEQGVNYTARKTERFLKDELAGNDQLLNVASNTILDSLQDGIDRVNEVFGTDWEVELSPDFNPTLFKAGTMATQMPINNVMNGQYSGGGNDGSV